MRRLASGIIVLGMSIALAPAAGASLLSKTFEFKNAVTLEVGAANQDGLRLDTVRFQLPSPSSNRWMPSGRTVNVQVALSNTTDKSMKVGIAVALFDEAGRLVGAATGGTKLMPIKPGRQKDYKLVFDGANGEAYLAKTFQISIETKP
jgi:hypothetical protein